MGDTLLAKLPEDVTIHVFGKIDGPKIKISMTLETLEHAAALAASLDIFIIPLLRGDAYPKPSSDTANTAGQSGLEKEPA